MKNLSILFSAILTNILHTPKCCFEIASQKQVTARHSRRTKISSTRAALASNKPAREVRPETNAFTRQVGSVFLLCLFESEPESPGISGLTDQLLGGTD